MSLDIAAQQERFLSLCREKIHREGLEDLLGWLTDKKKCDFFTAPASTKYHGAYEGGLCEHSLDVWDFAQKFAAVCPCEVSEESLLISSLFHDLCKVNFYGTEYRNQKINGEWQKIPVYVVNEKFAFGGHGSKSVFVTERFMRLDPEEAIAINCHMGYSEGGDSVRNVSRAYESSPLAWIIHAADEAATFLLER